MSEAISFFAKVSTVVIKSLCLICYLHVLAVVFDLIRSWPETEAILSLSPLRYYSHQSWFHSEADPCCKGSFRNSGSVDHSSFSCQASLFVSAWEYCHQVASTHSVLRLSRPNRLAALVCMNCNQRMPTKRQSQPQPWESWSNTSRFLTVGSECFGGTRECASGKDYSVRRCAWRQCW